eukprot:Plantae.Rhodophyta-Purpureofilum_apyrenoidigerum.ctg8253.p1 GENE.Plantae.Rhodophyta-Purpureofilum_apyrenoidigerum.ctg8253~~Plantae.Rhodophyta-Purpureofilum_apyrenoidigerum.ctg8253.p1  ORF type:complete len:327 (-),score=71.07 Plantae.Rhodophyta-Purpureofilum_apyrenoidigerum.ctg8253:29-865(-)
MSKKDRVQRAIDRKLEDKRKFREEKFVAPHEREATMKTFAESHLSYKSRTYLTRKGVFSEDDPAANFEKGWLLASATVLVRAHVLKPSLPEELAKFQEHKFHYKNEKNKPLNEQVFKKEGLIELPDEDVFFTPSPKETEADRRKDVRSVWRRLDERLYFVFKPKKNTTGFQFPQRLTADNETMRASAKKALKLVAGSSLKCVHHVGHAPLAVYKRVFGEEQQKKTKAYGAKVFFYPAYIIEGNVRKLDQGYDFRWLTKAECASQLTKDYYTAVKDMLF